MTQKITRINQIAKENNKIIFTSIYQMIDRELLKECFDELNGNKAVGIDKVTKDEYLRNLPQNLENLVNSLKTKKYKPMPSRRVYIPKSNGKLRSLAIASFEDKIVQLALKKVLEAIFEPRFSNNMYGFRKSLGCHDALAQVAYDIEWNYTSYVVEADIKGFFDNINHDNLMKCLKLHVKDTNILILVRKFLNAGVFDKGQFYVSEYGTPQGSIVSPILANIYMYYSLIKWFEKYVKPKLRGFASIINYADDFICCFQHKDEAEYFYKVLLPKRLKEVGLELAPDKTRLIAFGRFALNNTKVGKPETFDFLGFTHYCSKSKKGKFRVKRKTSRSKFNKKLVEFNMWCKDNRAMPIEDIMNTVKRKLIGHYNYFGITDNYHSICKFYYRSLQILFKWLNRRSQRRSYTKEEFKKLLVEYNIPKPYIKVNIYDRIWKQFEE